MNTIKILIYSTPVGNEPYTAWESKLDIRSKAVIKNRLDRVRLGNFGDAKIISGCSGLWELRIDYGSGYRIYFGKKGTTIIILLAGGNKKSQKRDISMAKERWTLYKGLK